MVLAGNLPYLVLFIVQLLPLTAVLRKPGTLNLGQYTRQKNSANNLINMEVYNSSDLSTISCASWCCTLPRCQLFSYNENSKECIIFLESSSLSSHHRIFTLQGKIFALTGSTEDNHDISPIHHAAQATQVAQGQEGRQSDAKICGKPSVPNAYVATDGREYWGVGDKAEFRCKPGYCFCHSDVINTVTCLDTERWGSNLRGVCHRYLWNRTGTNLPVYIDLTCTAGRGDLIQLVGNVANMSEDTSIFFDVRVISSYVSLSLMPKTNDGKKTGILYLLKRRGKSIKTIKTITNAFRMKVSNQINLRFQVNDKGAKIMINEDFATRYDSPVKMQVDRIIVGRGLENTLVNVTYYKKGGRLHLPV